MLKNWYTLATLIKRFGTDRRGQIAVLFSLSSIVIVLGLGAGIDLSRAYVARQRLSQIAALTCQFSNRPSIAQTANATYGGSNGFQTYLNAVNAFAASSLTTQHWTGALPTGSAGGAYFTATAPSGASGASATGPTNQVVDMSAKVATSFLQIARIATMNVHAAVKCQTPATTPQIVNPQNIIQEGFETACASYCYTQPNGLLGLLGIPSSATQAAPSYVGSTGNSWYTLGYCLETDITGVINATSPEGNHTAELDCGNNPLIATAGNSSISTKVYLANGNYELRYFYRSRVDYPNYDPAYICGSTAGDTSWANDTAGILGIALRTNQINVYLDLVTSSSIPLHTTIDGLQQLGGSNLIDLCVYSKTWIERSVKINVTTPAFYWLSFAADGANDSYGGQLDSIRLCPDTCAGSPMDNFPASWLAANNGGINKVLFEDTFESPTYTQDYPYHYIAKGGNLALSFGTSGTAASGWPSQIPSGWATGPFNQVTYALNGAYQGQQYIALDGYNAIGTYPKNRLITRPFLLDPGYYQVSYDYVAMVDFSSAGIYGTYCFSAPGSGQIFSLLSNYTGTIRYYTTTTANADTNIIGAFMANQLLISVPTLSIAPGVATPFVNPDGTLAIYPFSPAVSPDAVNYQNYDATQVNPLIDVCGYSDSYRWVPRTVAVKITKPGLYWLTFSATGGTGNPTHTGDGNGGGIDDVKLTALGSPYMANPPTSALTAIPVPSPQPDTVYTNNGVFNGFSIVADPFTPPAANP